MRLFVIVLMAALLGGCESTRRYVGIDKVGPNEYDSTRCEPLEIPEDMPPLTEPRLGIRRPQEKRMEDTVRDIIISERSPSKSREEDPHQAEAFLLKKAGTGSEDRDIRKTVDSESHKELTFEEKLKRTVTFWKTPKKGNVIDSAQEKERLEKETSASKNKE